LDQSYVARAKPRRRRGNFIKVSTIIACGLGIFWLGVGVGSGKIGPDSIYHKPVASGLPKNLDYSSVEEIYDELKSSYDGQLTRSQLLDGIKTGLAQATGDPYTEYFSPKAAKQFNEQLSGSFSGIGAVLGKDKANNLVVISPIAGSPADKAGLKAADIISEINKTSTIGMNTDEAVSRIRGDVGTKVTLKLIRAGVQTLSLTITRDNITIPSVTTKTLDGNIGYLQISQFSEDTAELAAQAATKFKQDGVKGIVLDLRGDPGGLLNSAVSISSLWLPKGKTILTERRGGSTVKTFTSDGTNTLGGIPTVVLIDGGSASASEITAAALRDNKVATLMGVTSFGKGSVQEINKLPGGAELKVTIAHWFTPAGKNIDKQGIKPDKEVKQPKDLAEVQDPQLDAAKAFLTK